MRGPDGTIFLSRTLKPGDRYRPELGAGWTLHAKDGGAFEVALDGASLGLLGQDNAPVLGRRVDTLPTSVSVVAPKPVAKPAIKHDVNAAYVPPAPKAEAPAVEAQAPAAAAPAATPAGKPQTMGPHAVGF